MKRRLLKARCRRVSFLTEFCAHSGPAQGRKRSLSPTVVTWNVPARAPERRLFLVFQNGVQFVAGKFLAPFQKLEFDEEAEAGDPAAQGLDELGHGGGRPARRQDVVDDQNFLAFIDCVAVDLERVLAVLELIGHSSAFVRKFFGFADGHKAKKLPDRKSTR